MTGTTAMTIDLGEGLSQRLADRAAENGHSVQEEIRLMVQHSLVHRTTVREPGPSLGEQIRAIVAPIGGVELELPPRGEPSAEE